MHKLFIILFLFSLHGSLMAQQGKKKLAFRSINQLGILYGESGQEPLVQTINGVSYKTWFAGIGAGLDFYRLRSVPLFLDVRKEFPVAALQPLVPFVYGDGGMHFAWPRTGDHTSNYESKFNNGAWFDAGLGCKVATKSRQTILLSAGYTYKRVEERITPVFSGRDQVSGLETVGFNYNLNRIAVKFGWMF